MGIANIHLEPRDLPELQLLPENSSPAFEDELCDFILF